MISAMYGEYIAFMAVIEPSTGSWVCIRGHVRLRASCMAGSVVRIKVGLRCRPPAGEDKPVWHWSRRALNHRRSARTSTAIGSFQAKEMSGFSRCVSLPSDVWRLHSSRMKLRWTRPSLSLKVMSQLRRIASRIQLQKGVQGKAPQKCRGFNLRTRAIPSERFLANRKSWPWSRPK